MNATIEHFGLTENEIIRKNGEFYFSTKTISQFLGIPINNVQQNIYRHKEEFGEVLIDSQSTNKVGRPSMLLDEEQLYIYCMISRSEKARALHREFAKMIKGIRTKEFIHISAYRKLLIELDKTRTKLLEEENQNGILSKIPKNKLNRYKKFRKLGLSRKELCKALDLPYSRMREADKILGFYRPNPGAAKALIPYQRAKGVMRRHEAEADLFGGAK
jgi:prophage antirepressor-like protein